MLKGKEHPNWKGGVIKVKGKKRKKGRRKATRMVRVKTGEYMNESRLVMQNHIGRELTKDDVVHHINGKTLDNRIENLFLTNNSFHTKIHRCSVWNLFWEKLEK
jgi:hypothetical protein